MLFVLTFIPFISSSSIGEFQLDVDNVEIYQTCDNCTYCNFTRVSSPDNSTIFSNIEATKDNTYYYYNILKDNFTETGEYKYCYDCGNLNEKETGCIDFEITYTGKVLTIQDSIIYLLGLGFLVFLFILVVNLVNKLPSSDAMDEEGSVIQVNQLKHLRPMLWGINWVIVLSMVFIISNMAIAYLPSSMLGNFFFVLYQIMFWITIIMLPLYWIWIFLKIWKDREVKNMLERGVNIKGTP